MSVGVLPLSSINFLLGLNIYVSFLNAILWELGREDRCHYLAGYINLVDLIPNIYDSSCCSNPCYFGFFTACFLSFVTEKTFTWPDYEYHGGIL